MIEKLSNLWVSCKYAYVTRDQMKHEKDEEVMCNSSSNVQVEQ